MPDIGRLTATATLNTHGFENPLKSARESLGHLKSMIGTLAAPLAALGVSFAAFRSAESMAESFKGVLEAGKQLQAMHRITGESIRDLVVLRKAYEEAGMDAGTVSQSLVMLQTALGGVNDEGLPTKEIFNQLGLSMTKLKGETAIQQFREISAALGRLSTQSEKTAAIRQIFGRQGAQMEALFGNPEAINEAAKAVGAMGMVMQQNAATFAQLSNSFDQLGAQSMKFFAGFAGQVAPALNMLLKKVNAIDLTRLGAQAGMVARTLMAAFQDGNLSELLSLTMQVGIEKGMAGITNPNTWDALGNMIRAAFDGLGAMIIEQFKPALNMVDAVIAEAVSRLTGGRVDPMRDEANTQYKNAQLAEDSLSAQQDRLLKMKPGPERDKKWAEVSKLMDQAEQQSQAALPLIDGHKATQPDYLNFQNQKDPLSDIGAQKRASGGQAYAAAVKQFGAALSANGNAAPETMARLKSVWSKTQANMPKLPAAAPDTAAPGAGKIAAIKAAGEHAGGRRDEQSDRLAKIGLFVGGSSPATDYARRTAVATERLVAFMAGRGLISNQINGGAPLATFT